jgi:hypothetical protein
VKGIAHPFSPFVYPLQVQSRGRRLLEQNASTTSSNLDASPLLSRLRRIDLLRFRIARPPLRFLDDDDGREEERYRSSDARSVLRPVLFLSLLVPTARCCCCRFGVRDPFGEPRGEHVRSTGVSCRFVRRERGGHGNAEFGSDRRRRRRGRRRQQRKSEGCFELVRRACPSTR